MTFPSMKPAKVILESVSQPKLVHKSSGQVFVVVRDDVKENGKLYIAPVGAITSMKSIRPEEVKEFFEWYTEPSQRPKADVEVNTSDLASPPTTQESVEASMKPKSRGRPKGSKNKKTTRRARAAKVVPAT